MAIQTVTRYVTSDGTEFSSIEAAEAYEVEQMIRYEYEEDPIKQPYGSTIDYEVFISWAKDNTKLLERIMLEVL